MRVHLKASNKTLIAEGQYGSSMECVKGLKFVHDTQMD